MGMAPLRSTRIRKKLKSVPNAIRSIRIKEYRYVEKSKKFPVFNEIKNGDPFLVLKTRLTLSFCVYFPKFFNAIIGMPEMQVSHICIQS